MEALKRCGARKKTGIAIGKKAAKRPSRQKFFKAIKNENEDKNVERRQGRLDIEDEHEAMLKGI